MVTIRQATPQDAQTIQQLAEIIWWPTYEPILGKEQVRYMLNLFYNTEKVKQQISTGEQTYLLLEEDNKPLAFAAYAPRTENQDAYKLHKLYCHPDTRHKGYGRILVKAVEEATRAAGKSTLELNVNRYNPAITFYEKIGFSTAYVEDIEIGNGYQMNDYVMRKYL